MVVIARLAVSLRLLARDGTLPVVQFGGRIEVPPKAQTFRVLVRDLALTNIVRQYPLHDRRIFLQGT